MLFLDSFLFRPIVSYGFLFVLREKSMQRYCFFLNYANFSPKNFVFSCFFFFLLSIFCISYLAMKALTIFPAVAASSILPDIIRCSSSISPASDAGPFRLLSRLRGGFHFFSFSFFFSRRLSIASHLRPFPEILSWVFDFVSYRRIKFAAFFHSPLPLLARA